MYLRRQEDRPPAAADTLPDLGLAGLAAAYLRDTLRRECVPLPLPGPAAARPAAPEPAPGGPADAAERRREWRRRWRRLRLADQVSAFAADLAGARSTDAVLDAFAAHAVRVVGAYFCVLFVPAAGGGRRLRARAEPRLGAAAERLELARVPRAAVLGPTATRRYPGLAPLFARAGAASLACTPFAGGAAVLVERREDRAFDAEDRELLRLLAAQAEAALERVRAVEGMLAGRLPATPWGGAGARHADAVLRQGEALARDGEPVAVALVSVGGPAGLPAAGELSEAAAAFWEAVSDDGVALHCGAGEFLLVFPGKSEAEARAAVDTIRGRVSPVVHLRASVAGRGDVPCSLEELVARAAEAVPA